VLAKVNPALAMLAGDAAAAVAVCLSIQVPFCLLTVHVCLCGAASLASFGCRVEARGGIVARIPEPPMPNAEAIMQRAVYLRSRQSAVSWCSSGFRWELAPPRPGELCGASERGGLPNRTSCLSATGLCVLDQVVSTGSEVSSCRGHSKESQQTCPPWWSKQTHRGRATTPPSSRKEAQSTELLLSIALYSSRVV
jgi:hypothetical protein